MRMVCRQKRARSVCFQRHIGPESKPALFLGHPVTKVASGYIENFNGWRQIYQLTELRPFQLRSGVNHSCYVMPLSIAFP